MSLSALDLDVLRLCAIADWTSPEGEKAWADLAASYGRSVNDAPVRAKLYRAGLVDIGDRITLAGRVELRRAS